MADDDEHTLEQDTIDSAVLDWVRVRHPAPVHVADLARAFEGDDWQTSVSGLIVAGAFYQEGSLLIISDCTLRVSELSG